MAFSVTNSKGTIYYLHSRIQKFRYANVEVYYFAKEIGEGAQVLKPVGYEVGENSHTGVPVMKKVKA